MKIAKILQKMKVKNGDILIIKNDSEIAKNFEEVMDAMKKMGYRNVLLLLVDDFEDVVKADPRVMRRYGWIKLPVRMNVDMEPQEVKLIEDDMGADDE